MTTTPPEPLPPVAPAVPQTAVAPSTPYANVPATSSSPYSATPVVVDPRRERNPFGVAALIVMLVSFVVPIGFFFAPIVASAAAGSEIGWGILGGFVFFVLGLIPAAGLGVIAVILAIVSLVRSNKKVLGIITLVLSTPLVLFALLLVPGLLGGDFF